MHLLGLYMINWEMYKLKKNSMKIVKMPLFLVSILFLISACFSGELNLTPLNFLNKWVSTAEKNLEINGAKWKAVVKNLYSSSLKQADMLQMSPMLTSVKNTTKSLNDTYLCTLKDNDVVNILYKTNDNFRKNLKNASSNFQKPTKNDMVNSCWILMGCVLTWYNGTKIVDTVSYCDMIVNDYYINEYKNSYNTTSLPKWNDWLEAFWNNSLKDSSYDILYDTYILAKILFDSPEEPEETLFYKMPDVSTTSNNIDTYVEIRKNRFSPYTQTETWNNGWWNSWNNDWWNTWGDDWWNSWDWEWYWNNVEWGFDSEFLGYSETYTREWQEWYEFLGDDCSDWFTIDWYEWSTYTVTYEWTQGGNDGWNDEWNNPWGEWGQNWWGGEWGESWNPNPDLPPQIPDDLEDLINNNPELSWDTETLTCFSSCNDISCTATSCDRLACYANCLCLNYESPEIGSATISWLFVDNVVLPWLWSIFKIKFCLQPVQDGKVSSSKKVNNLESIIKEINTVIQNLRNSWQLMLNKKTREFLDAWFQHNSLQQTKPSIGGNQKTPKPVKPEYQLIEEQTNLNTSLMENILWFEKDPTINGTWRDKYVIKWWKVDWWNVSQTQTQTSMANIHIDNSTLVSSLQSEHLTDMWAQFSEFLDSNIDFWISLKEFLTSMNNTAEALLKKKNN